MITRNDLYRKFRDEFNLPGKDARMIFRTITDHELAQAYGLKVLRKGYFVR